MDLQSVISSTNEELNNLGLISTGHKINLRTFCSTSLEAKAESSTEDKKRKLLESFRSNRKSKIPKTTSTKSTQANLLLKKSKRFNLVGCISMLWKISLYRFEW